MHTCVNLPTGIKNHTEGLRCKRTQSLSNTYLYYKLGITSLK